jgi:hypothetical protein
MAKVYDNATDLITFARSSSGTALRRVGYGDELVVDGSGNWVGDFDVAADLDGWGTGGNPVLSVSGSTATVTSNGGNITFSKAITVAAGKVYRVTGSISNVVSTGPRFKLGSSVGGTDYFNARAAGDYDELIVATSSTLSIYVQCIGAGSLDLDNVSVKEVIFDRPTDDLVLFNHPDDIPRIEYAADGSLKGLLIEEQRTNLITESTPQSGDLDVSGGSFSYVTCNFTPLSGPGIHFDTSGVTSYAYFQPTYTVADYTLSVFVEMDDGNAPAFGGLSVSAVTNDFALVVEATPVNALTYIVEHFGGNTYRVSCTLTAASTAAANTGVIKYSGNSTRTFKVTGFQIEEGSFPTSYIPTSGSQKTRDPDIASIPVSAFGYNQSAGTVVVEGTRLHDAGSLSYASLNDGSGINRFTLYIQSTEKVNGYAFGNGGALTLNGPTISPPTSTTWGMSYAKIPTGGRYELAVDGAIYDNSDSIYGEFSGKTQLSIGSAWGFSEFANGHIKSLSYFPRRLTDAQLQELTS